MDTVKNKTPFDFERFKEEAMEGLYQGKKMGGTDGVFSAEKCLLHELPKERFEIKHYGELKVATNGHVYLSRDKHYYSVKIVTPSV